MTSSSYDLIPSRRHAVKNVKLFVALALLAGLTPAMAALSAVAPPPVGASHIRANQISWHRTGPTTAEFHVSGSWKRSFFGNPNVGATFFPSPFAFGDGTQMNPPFVVIAVDAVNDVVTAEAHVNRTYATTGPYTAFIDTGDRLGGPLHRNNPHGHVRLESVVDLAGTSASPESQMSPIVDCPIDSVCRFNVPATDADSQSINYRRADAGDAGSGFVQPAGSQIHPTSGQYSWGTTGADLNSTGDSFFSTQVIIENLVGQTVVATTPVDFFIRVTDSPNAPPAFQAPTPADGAELTASIGQSISFQVSAIDPDSSDIVTLSVLGVPSGAQFTSTPANPVSGTFTFTPPAAGTTILTLLAQDQNGLGAVQRSVTLRVTSGPNHPPTFVPPTAAGGTTFTGHRGTEVAVPLSVEDPDPGDQLTISVQSGPPGAAVTAGDDDADSFFTWTPSLLGSASATVRVADAAGDFEDRTFNFNVVNRPPEFDSPTPASATPIPFVATGSGQFTVKGTDPDPELVRLATLGLPPGASYNYVGSPANPSQAVFSWTPPTAGTRTVTFSTYDESGAIVLRTLTLNVTHAPSTVIAHPAVARVSTRPAEVRPDGTVVLYDVYFPYLSAEVRSAEDAPQPGKPLANRIVKFFAGNTFVCQGKSGLDGQAFCQGAAGTSQLEVLLNGGYRAEFAGDATYAPVDATGPLIQNAL